MQLILGRDDIAQCWLHAARIQIRGMRQLMSLPWVLDDMTLIHYVPLFGCNACMCMLAVGRLVPCRAALSCCLTLQARRD